MKLRRLLATILSVVMICSCTSVTAFAKKAPKMRAETAVTSNSMVDNFVGADDDYAGSEYGWLTEGQLSSQDGSKDKHLGKGWNKYEINNPMATGIGEDDTYRVWKLEVDGGIPDIAHLWFFNDNTGTYEEYDVTSFSVSGRGAKALIIMPDGYRLVGGCFNPAKGINANYAGSHKPENTGNVSVITDINAWHNEIATYKFYDRSVYKYYSRAVDVVYKRPVTNFYQRAVTKFYGRSVDNFYSRAVDVVYQRYAQRYQIPVFEREAGDSHYYDETLVTRLDYDGNDVGSKPVNGGAFKNGHTYVTVNVAEASADNGVNYTIADSSKNNGKKTPDQYNRPIDYTYNVKIKDGKLTVSFPDNLVYASVGCYVWDNAPKDAKNAPKHYKNTVTVDVPENDGTVDLYFHLEKLSWNDFGESGNSGYVFKEWKYDDSLTEYDAEYSEVDTRYGEYELVDTQYNDYGIVDIQYGDYEYVDTQYGDYYVADTQYGEYYLEDILYGDCELTDIKTQTNRVEDDYTGSFTLTVDGKIVDIGELNLSAGEHTFVLSGAGFDDVTKTVSILPGENEDVVLQAEVQGEDVILDTVEVYTDNEEIIYYDYIADEIYIDEVYTEYYDIENIEYIYYENSYFYDEYNPVYNEEYLYKEDIKLGNEDDPFGEYAERIN